MIAALLLAVACVPDAAFSPSPAVTWDKPCKGATSIACWNEPAPPGEDCAAGCYDGAKPDGYVLYWQRPGVAFDNQRRLVLPCRVELGDHDEPVARYCPGLSLPYSVQKFNGSQLEDISYAVSAYDAHGESPLSNVVTICMPQMRVWP